uniref:Transposase n=1 Tax=Angiostrongylus cantonensis TaxID=6313 RepID=A0A0K0DQA3_ANGCA
LAKVCSRSSLRQVVGTLVDQREICQHATVIQGRKTRKTRSFR